LLGSCMDIFAAFLHQYTCSFLEFTIFTPSTLRSKFRKVSISGLAAMTGI
jgi:hypothetical protein